MNKEHIEELPKLIQKLYAIVADLHGKFPNWEFTPDGRLVGDIGEALVCYHFDLEPLAGNEKTHDAKTIDGKLVQIKTTQKETLGLGLQKREFQHLIALFIDANGDPEIVYNGSGKRVWSELGDIKSTAIGVKRLRKLNETVPDSERLQKKR
jgi:hypothetical protein